MTLFFFYLCCLFVCLQFFSLSSLQFDWKSICSLKLALYIRINVIHVTKWNNMTNNSHRFISCTQHTTISHAYLSIHVIVLWNAQLFKLNNFLKINEGETARSIHWNCIKQSKNTSSKRSTMTKHPLKSMSIQLASEWLNYKLIMNCMWKRERNSIVMSLFKRTKLIIKIK